MLKPFPSDAPHNGQCMNMCTSIYIYIHMYSCCIYVFCMSIYLYVSIYIYILVFLNIYIYCHIMPYIYIPLWLKTHLGFNPSKINSSNWRSSPRTEVQTQTNTHIIYILCIYHICIYYMLYICNTWNHHIKQKIIDPLKRNCRLSRITNSWRDTRRHRFNPGNESSEPTTICAGTC